MVKPKRVHWTTMRHVLRYLRGTIEYGLKYTQGDDVRLCGFVYADWIRSSVDRKSTSRYYVNVVSRMVLVAEGSRS